MNYQKIYIEPYVNKGDICLFYATLIHCVDTIYIDNKLKNFNDLDGRWWIGLYSPESDLIKDRASSQRMNM